MLDVLFILFFNEITCKFQMTETRDCHNIETEEDSNKIIFLILWDFLENYKIQILL